MKKLLALTIAAVALAGCSDSSSKDKHTPIPLTENSYVIQTVATDYGSAQVAIGNLIGDRSVKHTILADDNSDVSITTYNNTLYRLDKKNAEISAFDAKDITQKLWNIGVNIDGETKSANPYAVTHISDDKAYVIRYNSKDMWEINQQGEKQSSFDLSAYAAGDAFANADAPNAMGAVSYNDNLYVIMQRLDEKSNPKGSYIAVIDSRTNEELETNQGENGLKGIKLNADNASDYALHNGYLYVAGRGDYGDNSGALDKIDLTTNEVTKVADGNNFTELNDADNFAYAHIIDVAIVDNQTGYLLVVVESYPDYKSSIFKFNPTTNTLGDKVEIPAIDDARVSDITIDANGRLWIAIADEEAPQVLVYDTDTNTQNGDAIKLDMPPSKIEFLTIQ